jgi:hypothetical protein
MHGGPIDTILFVHGYSVTNLNSFNQLPALFAGQGFKSASLYLAGWISLDDRISCSDLAASLEERVASLEANVPGFDLGRTLVITHSTGAIITRRWILDRYNRRKVDSRVKTLSHFVSCAGANHGSTMAQLGTSELAYIYRNLTEGQAVGKRVLQDLDYGSAFLRALNREWMTAWNDMNDPLYADTFCFSMGGTDHSFWQNQLTWQSREFGSDGTVRISGANLNYTWITVGPPTYGTLQHEVLAQSAPHLVIESAGKRYSHTSQNTPDNDNLVFDATGAVATIMHLGQSTPVSVSKETYGIVEGIASPAERPFTALGEAIGVQDVASYKALSNSWAAETNTWSSHNTAEVNSTAVVAVLDESRSPIDDSLVVIKDSNGIGAVTDSLLGNQPIPNAANPSIKSFYINTAKFEQVHGHQIHVAALADTPYVTYGKTIDGPLSNVDPTDNRHVIQGNEFTYVDVFVARDPAAAFAIYGLDNPNLPTFVGTNFPPFDPRGRM